MVTLWRGNFSFCGINSSVSSSDVMSSTNSSTAVLFWYKIASHLANVCLSSALSVFIQKLSGTGGVRMSASLLSSTVGCSSTTSKCSTVVCGAYKDDSPINFFFSQFFFINPSNICNNVCSKLSAGVSISSLSSRYRCTTSVGVSRIPSDSFLIISCKLQSSRGS